MPFSDMRALLVLVVALAAASAPTSATSAHSADPSLERRQTLERQIQRELNRVRATRGLRALRSANGLRTAAVSHSRAMVELGFFAHESADGTAFQNRIRRHYPERGWKSWSVAETLLSSTGGIEAGAIVAAWLASPPHRAIILSSTWRDVGIGALYGPSAPGRFGGAETIVVTADFGLRVGNERARSSS